MARRTRHTGNKGVILRLGLILFVCSTSRCIVHCEAGSILLTSSEIDQIHPAEKCVMKREGPKKDRINFPQLTFCFFATRQIVFY